MESSSIHKINGDFSLASYESKLYFLLNYFNNAWFPHLKKGNIQFFDYQFKNLASDLALLDGMSSPARKLSDLFWKSLRWDVLREVLNEDIEALDVGCGTGKYYFKLQEFSENSINSYVGVDFVERSNWKESDQNSNVRFYQGDSASITPFLENRNFIFTQSAVEHFPKDMLFFKQVGDYVSKNRNQPIIQVHLLPAPASLTLYREHGVRQYTPRTISKLVDQVPNDFSCIIPLGGKEAYNVHYRWLTKRILLEGKSDLRETNKDSFSNEVNEAIINDQLNNNKWPHFYALVIGSNLGRKYDVRDFLV